MSAEAILPADAVEVLRASFAMRLCVEWKPHGPPTTLRLTADGIDGALRWDCWAFFAGLAPMGRMLGRPAGEATEGALVQLAEALDRDAAARREESSRDAERSEELRATATRMDAAAVVARMTIARLAALRAPSR